MDFTILAKELLGTNQTTAYLCAAILTLLGIVFGFVCTRQKTVNQPKETNKAKQESDSDKQSNTKREPAEGSEQKDDQGMDINELRQTMKCPFSGVTIPLSGPEAEKAKEEGKKFAAKFDPYFDQRKKTLEESNKKKSGGGEKGQRDPIEFCEHIPAEVKKMQMNVTRKKIEEGMSQDERAKERDIQRQQLEAIYSLMKESKEFGVDSMEDMQAQMKLYTA